MEPEIIPEMNPERVPKPSLFGVQESSENLCFPCVLPKIDPRRGSQNEPEMEPKMTPEMDRIWLPEGVDRNSKENKCQFAWV